MKIILNGKNKLGFILRTYKKEMYDLSLHKFWDRCNVIVLAWITNVVSQNLISIVIYVSDTHKVWEDLKERLDKVNTSKACYLHKKNRCPYSGYIICVYVLFKT